MSKHLVLLLAALLLVSLSAGCQKAEADQEKRPVPVNVQPVELQTPEQGVRYTASIVPAAQVEVTRPSCPRHVRRSSRPRLSCERHERL
jgi:hypothetical protein